MRPQALGLSLHDSALALRAKIGSSEFVKSDHIDESLKKMP